MNDVKLNIAEAYIELVEEKEIKDITIAQITEKSKLSRSTFYRYFTDVYEVIRYVFYTDVKRITQIFLEKNNFIDTLNNTLTKFKEKREFYTKAMKLEGPNSFRSQYVEITVSISKESIGTRYLNDSLNFSLELYWIGASHIIQRWIISRMPEPTLEMAQFLYDAIPHTLIQYFD